MTPRVISTAIAVLFLVTWVAAAAWAGRTVSWASSREQKALYAAGLLFCVGMGIAVAFVPAMRMRLWPEGDPLDWALAAVFATGLAICWWARLHLGRLWSGGVVVKEGHRVVDTGPYAIVRHPIYTGAFIAMVPFCAIRARPVDLLFGAAFIVFFALKARIEERFLCAQLGPDYERYRERVPMLVPFNSGVSRRGPPTRTS